MVEDREEQRRQKAYALWEEEGRPEGRHDAHWQQADEDDIGDGAELDDDDNLKPAAGKSSSATTKP